MLYRRRTILLHGRDRSIIITIIIGIGNRAVMMISMSSFVGIQHKLYIYIVLFQLLDYPLKIVMRNKFRAQIKQLGTRHDNKISSWNKLLSSTPRLGRIRYSLYIRVNCLAALAAVIRQIVHYARYNIILLIILHTYTTTPHMAHNIIYDVGGFFFSFYRCFRNMGLSKFPFISLHVFYVIIIYSK